jgi:hypothetical protein
MNGVQPTGREPVLDGVPGVTQLEKLGASDHPVLATREAPD